MSEDDSSVGMTVKAMVQELYGDMKVVRPIVEALDSAKLDHRLTTLELRSATEAATAVAMRSTAVEFFRLGRWVILTAIGLATVISSFLLLHH
jgi:hypothetical protein